jgi:hypothetical protein
MVTGYAYVDSSGVINVKTVGPTELSAKVNTIVVESGSRVIPLNSWSLADVDKMLGMITKGEGKIAKVRVSLLAE